MVDRIDSLEKYRQRVIERVGCNFCLVMAGAKCRLLQSDSQRWFDVDYVHDDRSHLYEYYKEQDRKNLVAGIEDAREEQERINQSNVRTVGDETRITLVNRELREAWGTIGSTWAKEMLQRIRNGGSLDQFSLAAWFDSAIHNGRKEGYEAAMHEVRRLEMWIKKAKQALNGVGE